MGRGKTEDMNKLQTAFGTTGGLSRQTRKYARQEEGAGDSSVDGGSSGGGYTAGNISKKAVPPASAIEAHYKKYGG
jgi:hypothetical protein